jgi:ribosome-associated protein
MDSLTLKDWVLEVLAEKKASNPVAIDVAGISSVTDWMVFVTGNTGRQVKALANDLVEQAKARKLTVLGVEGLETSEWVLVDLVDVVVHIMQPGPREFYRLEDLWSAPQESVVS